MSEKIVLEAEVKSNIGKQVKATEDWAKSIEQVNDEINDTNRYIIDQEKELIKLKAKQDAIPKGAWVAGMDKLNDKIRETSNRLKLSKNSLKGLKEEQKAASVEAKKFTQAQKDQKKATEDTFGSFRIFGLTLNGVKKSFSKIIPAAKAMFSTVKMGLLATGLGAFLVLLGAVVTYFKSSKKGADDLKTAMAGIGAVVNVFKDLFMGVGEAIVNAFKNPKEAINELWEFIKTNLMNRLTGMVDGFKGAMKIIESAIKLDWDGVKEGAEEYGRALVQVGTGMDVEQQKRFAQGIKDVVAEVKEEVKIMTQLERGLQRLRDAENDFLVTKAKTRKAVAQAKMDSKDETKTLEERRAALQSALDMQQATTDKEVALARQKMNIQQQQMATSTDMAADEQKLAELKATVYDKEASSLLQQKRLKSEMNSFDKEMAAEKQAILDEEEAAWDQKIADNDAWNEKQMEEAATLLELQQENALEEMENLRERALAELEIQENKDIAAAELMENSEAMLAAIKDKYTKKRVKVNEKADDDEEKSAKALKQMKINLALDVLNAIQQIAGKGTALAKAAAVAQATISGTAATLEAFKSGSANIPMMTATYGAYGFIQAGLAATFAALQIKNIMSAKPPSAGGGGGGGGPDATAAAPAPQMMSGAFDLAGGVEPEPTRAYVVTDEMTSSQAQLANIRRRATI
jgi:hypothetical protein